MCVSLNAYLEMYRQDIKTPDHINHNPFRLHTRDGAKHFTFAVQDEVLRLGIAEKHSNKIGLTRYLINIVYYAARIVTTCQVHPITRTWPLPCK